MSTATGLRPAAFASQDHTAAAPSESQATPRHPAIDAWGRAHERANTAEAALRRGRRVLGRWADRDLHRDAAQLLNELTAALGEDAEEQPAGTAVDPLRDLIHHATRLVPPKESDWSRAQLVGWNLAMAHVRHLVEEMPAGTARVVHFDSKPQTSAPPPVDDTNPVRAARAEGLRADRAQLLGLLAPRRPLGHARRPVRVVDLLSTADREQGVHRLIAHHVGSRRPPLPPQPTAAAADAETLRATLHGTGVVTIHPATTGTPRA